MRNSIWIVPAILGSLAIALGVALPNLDEGTTTTIGISFGGEAARGLLGALAGGMITFTGFVFSILLLAVQFGSSQFSPRMLRRFLREAPQGRRPAVEAERCSSRASSARSPTRATATSRRHGIARGSASAVSRGARCPAVASWTAPSR